MVGEEQKATQSAEKHSGPEQERLPPEFYQKLLAAPPCKQGGGCSGCGRCECHVTESVSKRGMEKVRPGKAGKASHIKGNSERA